METPDPPNDTPGALKQVVLTPRDIPWSLREWEKFPKTFHFAKTFFTQDLVSKRVDNRVALRLGGGLSNVWV